MVYESLQPWMALRAIEGLGDVALKRLIAAFGAPDRTFSAGRDELIAVGGLSPRQAEAVLRGPADEALRAIDREFRWLEPSGIRIVTCTEPHFPSRLREIPDPPLFIYVSGALEEMDLNAVAIVGSRRATAKGRLVTEEISRELAEAGFTIVSGLARGVDAVAHQAALSVGGCTVAVMGSGIDQTYPPEHCELRAKIERNGAVISELPVGAPPDAHHFPRRNRIISGLCLGVVVTEAAIESGSLITARLANEQGREVFAVPGFVKDDNSRGTNGLIRQGATLVETAADIIEVVLPQLRETVSNQTAEDHSGPSQRANSLREEEAIVYEQLSYEPIDLDVLIGQSGLSTAVVNVALLALELRGLVRQLPGPRIIRL